MAINNQTASKQEKREIDWQSVYDRIAAAQVSSKTAGQVSVEERERIWKERAVQFARTPEEEGRDELVPLAIVNLGRELCAFEVSGIESIRPMEEVTRVPRAPNWLVGIANLRGRIYSVTDLQKFLHLNTGQGQSAGKGEILMIKSQKMRLALRVDKVRSVEMVQKNRINAASDTIHGVKPEFIYGVIDNYEVNGEKAPVLVLNMEALLSDESLIVQEEFS